MRAVWFALAYSLLVQNPFGDVHKGHATGSRGAPKSRAQVAAQQLKTLLKTFIQVTMQCNFHMWKLFYSFNPSELGITVIDTLQAKREEAKKRIDAEKAKLSSDVRVFQVHKHK